MPLKGRAIARRALCTPRSPKIEILDNRDYRICLRGFIRDTATKRERYATTTRRPVDRLRTVTAWEHRETEKEEWALNLAAEIADQHGLKVSNAIRQLE